MSDNPSTIIISVASGKGGVGKTCIAANLAYIVSRLGRTLLLDLDLQNQGCTSLLTHQAVDTEVNSYDILNTGLGETEYGIKLRDNLFFVPATSWKTPPKQRDIYDLLNSVLAKDNLTTLLHDASTNRSFDFIIMDCHGGIDLLSYVAHHHSRYTLVVTEPDVVTFSGTLELIRFYEQSTPLAQTVSSAHSAPHTESAATDPETDVKFVVNRLQGKLSLKSLQSLYQPSFRRAFGGVSRDSSVFCYLPAEEMIANTFGQVPFFAEVVPKSTFAQKISYMAYELLSPHMAINSKKGTFKGFDNEKFRKRIYSAVRSIEQVAKQRALTFVGVVVGMVFVFSAFSVALAIFVGEVAEGVGGPGEPPPDLLGHWGGTGLLGFAALYALIAASNFFFLRVLRPMIRLYGQRIAFEKGLRRTPGASLVVFGRLRLIMLWVFRLGLRLMLLFTVFFFGGSLLAALGMLTFGIIGPENL
jgi:cellulose biosynthesis protein BcsQ